MAQRAHASLSAPCTQDCAIERRTAAGSRAPPTKPCVVHASPRGRGCVDCDVRHLALCAALKGDELPKLEAIVSSVSLAPGQALFGEDEPARYVYNVAAGTLRLFKLLPDGRRQITGFGFSGDFIGLTAGDAHPYGTEAVDQAELCRFPIQGLRELLLRFPSLEHRLLDMRTAELVAAQDRMVLLGRKTPMEKIASFLLEISARQERRGRPASPVTLPMTRSDIADYLGLTVETVSRCFTRLKGDRSIALPEPTSVELIDRKRLENSASGG